MTNNHESSGSDLARPAPGGSMGPTTLRGRRHWSWGLSASIVTIAVWYGSIRLPVGADVGSALPGQIASAERRPVPTTAPGRFRLGTFNIHGGYGTDGVKSVSRIAGCVKDCHFVGLNEVRGRWLWEHLDQARTLGERLGRDWIFAPAEERWGHHQFGNGALSAVRVEAWQRVPLVYRAARGYRNAVQYTLRVGEHRVQILATHLDRRSDQDRTAQLQMVGQWFLTLAPPCVLMGDLNTPADSAELRFLLESPGIVDPLRQLPPANPGGRIDWILLRGLKPAGSGTIDVGASDHPFYWVDCEFPE